MRSINLLAAAGLALGASPTIASEVDGGPVGVPYTCGEGRAIRVLYEGGGYFPRATAKVEFDGRTIEMEAVPPTYGLRYVSDEGGPEAPILVWSVRGEEAFLTEQPTDQSDARELARCTRLRGTSAVAEAPHGEGTSHQ